MSKSSRFWDRIAAKYAERPVADEAAYEHKLEVSQSYLAPDMEALELGCGTGSTAIRHAPHVKRIVATDLSANMLAIAEERANAEGIDNITFRRAALEELEAPGESFHAVFAMSLLHLLEDRDAALVKIRRWLKPGGVFISNTACVADTMWFLKFILPIGRVLGLVPLVRFFTTAQLVESIEQAGLDIEYQWTAGKGKAVFIVARKPTS